MGRFTCAAALACISPAFERRHMFLSQRVSCHGLVAALPASLSGCVHRFVRFGVIIMLDLFGLNHILHHCLGEATVLRAVHCAAWQRAEWVQLRGHCPLNEHAVASTQATSSVNFKNNNNMVFLLICFQKTYIMNRGSNWQAQSVWQV